MWIETGILSRLWNRRCSRSRRRARFLDRGGAGALRTLENARRSARSTRDIKGEALV